MRKFIMSNPENYCAVFIAGIDVFVAFDAECMVKETYGHALIPFFYKVWSP
jgi:hypothetical protein